MLNEELLIEASKNNSFNLADIEQTLLDVKHNSFNYLYNAQIKLVNHRRFDLKASDLVHSTKINKLSHKYPRKYVAYIHSDFISETNRSLYKKSPYYNKELSSVDIALHPELFTFTYMLFVDGKYIDSINIMCLENLTYFIFDINDGLNTTGIPKDYLDSLIANNADITIFFIPNCAYGVYNTNIYVLQKYIDNLSLSRFNIINNIDTEAHYITFVNDNDLLFSSIITDTSNSQDLLKFYDNNLLGFDSKYIHLNVFGLKNLIDQIDIVGTEKFFSIPIQDMPIPIENVIIFKNVDGKKYFAHNISLKLYYPNIYEIIGNENNDDLSIYVFYFNDNKISAPQFKNDLQLYYKFKDNILDEYKNNSVSTTIKEFTPSDYNYNISDFRSSVYNPDHLLYKLEKLKSWINQDNEILTNYLYKQIKKSSGYYLDISKINLNNKYRENNFNEITDVNFQETFVEPRYVFIFHNEYKSEFYHLRFFINGVLYVPDKSYKDNNYEYHYIPTNLINSNSIIEIEKFEEYSFTEDTIFSSLGTVRTFDISDSPLDVAANDIFLINTENKKYINKSLYKISIIEDTRELILDTESFKKINPIFSVRLIDDALLNINLSVVIRKNTFYQVYKIENENDVTEIMYFTKESINDNRQFRVFRNGLLIPFQYYNIDYSDQLTDIYSIGLNSLKLIGDTYVVDCTPLKYKQIYFNKDIPTNGFIDLNGVINKPFDLKWYDIYVNGQKMTKNNIEIISPTKIILKNIQSTKNLAIIEKNRDIEYFSLNNISSISDLIWDSITDFKNNVLTTINPEPIPNILSDIIVQIVDYISVDFVKYFELTMIPYIELINPDTTQISDADIATFPDIFTEENKILFINPDRGSNQTVLDVMKVYPEIK